MPFPLKPGYNFNYERIIRPPHYEMAVAEAYTDFYGISYMLKGERLIYSTDFTTIVQAGELVFIPKYVYRRTTYISNNSYERILIKFTDKMITGLLNKLIITCLRERIIGGNNILRLENDFYCRRSRFFKQCLFQRLF